MKKYTKKINDSEISNHEKVEKGLTKEECREWMNKYHDLWIKDHNKLIEIKRVMEE